MEGHPDVAAVGATRAGARKLFTLARAERALVLVRRIVTDAVASYSHLLQTQVLMERLQRCGPVDQIEQLQAEMTASAERLSHFLEELELVGVDLRDLARGEVDFAAVVSGRLVSLCWRLGEDGVGHWHGLNGDLTDRRPLWELIGSREAEPARIGPT